MSNIFTYTGLVIFFVTSTLLGNGQSYEQLNDKILQLVQTEKYAEAIPYAIRVVDSSRKKFGDTSKLYAQSLQKLGYFYYFSGNFPASEPLFEQALPIFKKVIGANNIEYGNILNTFGFLFYSMHNYSVAERIYKDALFIRKQILGENHFDYTETLNFLGLLYQHIGNYAEAESLYIKALSIRKNILGEDNSDYATSINNLAGLYDKLGNYSAAEKLYQQSISIRKKILGEEHPDYATSLNNLASLYENMGKYSDAEELIKQALTIRQKVLGEEHIDYAESISSLALLYDIIGNYSEAEQMFKQSLAIRKKALGEKSPDYAKTLNNLAGLYIRMNNYAAAEPLITKVSEIFKKTYGENSSEYATSISTLAFFYVEIGNYIQAEVLYKKALSIETKTFREENPQYAASLNNLADLYNKIGKDSAAENLYKKALSIRKKIVGEEHPDYSTSLNNLAVLYYKRGNYEVAEALYEEALNITKKLLGEHHSYFAAGLGNLAVLYEREGKYKLAAEYIMKSTSISLMYFRKNFNNLSEGEKLIWWDSESGNFHMTPSLLYKNTKSSTYFLQQTLTEQLQLKGLILNHHANVLQTARKGNPELVNLLNKWQVSKSILAKQYSLPVSNHIHQLDSLEKVTNELEKEINRQSSVIRTSLQNQQIGFREVQQLLKRDEAAIEFIRFNYYHKGWTDSILYAAFIILPNDTIPHFVPLFEEKELAALLDNKNSSSSQFVKALYRGVEPEEIQNSSKKSEVLYNLIWKPLQPFLSGITKINIAPAGLLNRIAFNALSIDSSAYLIDKYQLRQFTSVREIAEEKILISNTSSTDIVLYGGVNFNTSESTITYSQGVAPTLPDKVKQSIRGGGVWEQLPGTQQEIDHIRQLFYQNKKTTQSITGSAATEESLKQFSGNSPKILHLATHGFFLPNAEQKPKDNLATSNNQFTFSDNPLLRSGIIMAGANKVWSGGLPTEGKEDGIVTAYEISNLDLSNTELVVLSACETALGDIRGTEGVFGLQRAFKLAGVQNMILSLWQVPDKETAELMNSFYANKLKGLTNYEAFNKAQDAMRKKYSPFYWAAFVLIE